MTTRPMLMIETVAESPNSSKLDLLASVSDGRVWLETVGDTEITFMLSPDDWADLIAFVAAQMTPPAPRVAPDPHSAVAQNGPRPTPRRARRDARPIDEDAIIGHMQHLGAVDLVMPTALQWNDFASQHELPNAALLIRRAKWSDWAATAGLRLLRPYQRAQAGRKDGADATAAPFPTAR